VNTGNKVIIIIGPAWPLRGGLSTYNERLAMEFRNNGMSVSIETFSLQYPGFLFPGKSQYTDQPAPPDLEINATINSINPISWFKTGQRIRKLKPDIVVFRYWLPFMGPSLGTIARRIKRNKHTRIVTIMDNVIPHEKRPGDRIFTKYFIKPVDAFITMSEKVLDDLKKIESKKPASYCPHPLYDNFGSLVDKIEARKHLGLDPESRYLLFFGFIRDYKGLDLLIKAFSVQAIKKSGIRLIVAGEFYSGRDETLESIKRYQLEDQVILKTEYIPDEDVRYFFCASDLVVQPYKSATQSGISQIAYHFNKPMIVTKVGGLPKIVPDGEVGYVAEVDALSIAEKISMYFDRSREQEFTENIKLRKQLFSWDRMVRQIIEI